LEDIYYAIESRFPYFKTAPSGWKNSVRHNLSLNPCFEKVARPLTDRGKGHYWTVNDNVDPRTGVHRVRKKKTKGGKEMETDADADAEFSQDAQYDTQQYGDIEGEPNRVAYPPPYPPPHFDPNFGMITDGMRYVHPPQPVIPPELVDEHGNVDWRAAWHKELEQLQQVTDDHDKVQVDPEWYRMMLFRVRTSLMALPPPPLPPHDSEGAVMQQQQQADIPNPENSQH